jgi:hypothetical protein
VTVYEKPRWITQLLTELGDIPIKFIRLIKSRKFLAALAVSLGVFKNAIELGRPLEQAEVIGLIVTWVTYMVTTAWEDAAVAKGA